MKSKALILFLLLTQVVIAQNKSEQLARQFIGYLAEEQFTKATAMFSPRVLEKIQEAQVTTIWGQVQQQAGAFKEVVNVEVKEAGVFQQTTSLCQFEKSYLNIRLAFDESGQVAGIFFTPAEAPSAPAYELPPYADESTYKEVETKLSTPAGDLKAIYTQPLKVEHPPVIVFVHGSGPNDEDETLGPNKIFKDLATGLASRGIASYRYVKRSKAYPMSFTDQMTIDDEVVDDAVTAIAEARRLSSGPVFLLGHSLGGMMAPKIASSVSELTGVIILAGPNRPLEEMMIDQVDYILTNDTPADKSVYQGIKKVATRIQSGNYDADTPKSELMNIPASYWKDLATYDPLKTIKKVKKPVLVLQGERDYQVTMEDFERWKTAVKKRGKYLSYPLLNHMFYAGKGLCLPAEYQEKGFFNGKVIADIVLWVVTEN